MTHHSFSGFKQWSANCHPWIQLPVFVNKVLSQHGHAHSLSYSLHLLWATRAELSSCDRDHACEPEVFTIWPCKKKFAHSWLKTTMIYYFSQSWMLGNWAFLLLVSLELLKQLPSSHSLTGTEDLRQLFSGAWQWWLASSFPRDLAFIPQEGNLGFFPALWSWGSKKARTEMQSLSRSSLWNSSPSGIFITISRSKQVSQPTQTRVLGK